MPHDKDKQDQEEPKESHHIDHDTSGQVLEVMKEFDIPGDELKEPKQNE